MYSAILSLTVLALLRQATSIAPRQCSDENVSAAYYTDSSPLTSISWDRYNTLIFSFATTTPSVYNLSLAGSDSSLLTQFVSQAHENGVAAHGAIGGWTGSRFFSSNVATPENRTAFVQTVIGFAEQYGLDGLNFDWEYPAKQGIGCNVISLNDTKNFLSFLQELRQDPFGSQLTLTAAVPLTPFVNASGLPSTDVSDFSAVLDYIVIMNYDVFGSWSATVGPNAPLNDTCAPPADQVGSAVSAVDAWSGAGFPASKIVLGVAGYGHSFSVPVYDAYVEGSNEDLAAYPKFNASNQPPGDSQSAGGVDVCGVYEKPGGTYAFSSLIEYGFLTTDGKPGPGINYRFDACSQTAYVYNATTEVMISFDDPSAFAAKGTYILETGLKGFALWQQEDDYNNLLIDSIRTAAGFNSELGSSRRKRHWKRNWNF